MIKKKRLQELYLLKGQSVSSIAKLLNYSENKVNYWISRHGIPKRTIADALYLKKNPGGDPFKKPDIIRKKDLVLYGLGLGLFWGEGFKKSKNAVRLGNTDPKLIKTFLLFLERIYKIDKTKLRFGIQIFEDLKVGLVRNYWIKELQIKKSQIFPTIVVSPSRKKGTYRQKSRYGVLTVYFGNTRLKQVLDEHIELISKLD
jgi:hypothetical protein